MPPNQTKIINTSIPSTKMTIATTSYKTRREIYTILAVTLSAMTAGQSMAWTSPAIPFLTKNGISLDDIATITIIPSITSIFAGLLFGRIIDWIGRRPSILMMLIAYIISWIIIALANNSFLTALITPQYVYYIARVFTGIGDALFFACIPGYVTEIASPNIRGTWGSCVSIFFNTGQFLINVLGAYLSIPNTAFISICIPIIVLCNYHFIQESPYYLIMKGRIDEARCSLQWLRSSDLVEEELAQLIHDVSRQLSETGTWMDLLSVKANRKACLIGIFLRVAQQFSGIAVFTVFAQSIFVVSGSSLSPSTSAIIFTGLLAICAIIGSMMLDYIGRKKAILFSCTSCCLVLFLQAVFFYLRDVCKISLQEVKWFPLVGIIIFVPVYGIGLLPIPVLIMGEIFSSSIKSKAFAVLNVFYCLAIATSTKVFSVLFTNVGIYAAFLFFAMCNLLSCVMTYYIVPETRGKTLEEIQQDLK